MTDQKGNEHMLAPFGLDKFTDHALEELLASGEDKDPLGSTLAFEIDYAVSAASERCVRLGSAGLDMEQLEQELRAIWYRAIQIARHFMCAPPYYVVHQLLAAAARGDLLVQGSGDGSQGVAAAVPIRFRNGERLWTDLPFCAEALVHAISHDKLVFTQHRESVLAFIGQLFATGACGGRFDVVALHFLKYMLETPWTPGRSSAGPDELPCIYYSQPGEHPFLSALGQLLLFAAPRLAMLCNRSARCTMGLTLTGDTPGRGGGGAVTSLSTAVGELARQAGLDAATDGFSPNRWSFWARRLQEIMDKSTESPNYHPPDIQDMLGMMRKAALEAGGPCLDLTDWIKTTSTES